MRVCVCVFFLFFFFFSPLKKLCVYILSKLTLHLNTTSDTLLVEGGNKGDCLALLVDDILTSCPVQNSLARTFLDK